MSSRVLLLFLFAVFVVLCVGYPERNRHRRSQKKVKPPAPRTEIFLKKDYDKEAIGNFFLRLVFTTVCYYGRQ